MGFLAELDLDELRLFFSLLVKPLLPVSQGGDEMSETCRASSKTYHFEFDEPAILNLLTSNSVETLSWKKKSGFLHVVDDILAVFDEARIKPFLNVLINGVVLISSSCTSALGSDNDEAEDENQVIVCSEIGLINFLYS